jgi:hypothetical protein
MWAGIREMGRLVAPRWPELAAGGGVAGALWLLGFRLQGVQGVGAVKAGWRKNLRPMLGWI